MPLTTKDLSQIKKVVHEEVETATENLAVLINHGFNDMEQRFGDMEKRFAGVEGRLLKLELGQEELKVEMRNIKYLLQQKASVEDLNEINTRLTRVEIKLRKYEMAQKK